MPQRLSDIPMAELVPEARHWNGGQGIAPGSWIGFVGRVDHAIAYGEWFWPEVIEIDGCVFLSGATEEGYLSFLQGAGGDKRAVEAVMNHRHIYDLFMGAEPTREQAVYLGRLLQETWAAKLARDFPGRRFEVSFPEGETGEDPDYQVTFYQA